MGRFRAFALCGILFGVGAHAFADGASTVRRLRSADDLKRQRAEEEILRNRRVTISGLGDTFSKNLVQDPRVAVSAAQMLGQVRAEDAANMLSAHLKFSTIPTDRTATTPNDTYPLVGVLIDIGTPCVNPLISHTLERTDPLYSKLAALVLAQVLTPELAQVLLTTRIKAAIDPVKQVRLQQLRQEITALRAAQTMSAAERLGTTKEVKGSSAGEKIHRDRQAMIKALADALKDHLSKETRVAASAARLLGKLRADEAVSMLSTHLKFENQMEVVTRFPTTADVYPCAGALIAIGTPSVNPIVRNAVEVDDPLYSKLSAYLLAQVLTADLAEAFLAKRLKSEANPIKQRRLRLLQQDLATVRKAPGGEGDPFGR